MASALASRAELREPTLEAWLSALVAAGDDGFVAVTEPEVKDELFLYQAQSSATTGFCLRGAIDPHRGAKASATWEARAARHGAPDLLRCTWTAEGMTFTLTETASALVVGVERATKPAPPLDRAALLRLIQAVVQTETPDHSWRYEISEGAELQSGTHLITTRGAPAVTSMETRDDRADILLVEGRAWFLFAKKIRQRIGFEPTDTWFRGSTRDVTSRS